MKRGNLLLISIGLSLVILLGYGCGGTQIRTCEDNETICNDGIDNNCNNFADCRDSACTGLSCAPGKTCVSSGSCCVDSNSDGVCDGILIEYDFNEREGSLVYDRSGNNISAEFKGLRQNMLTGWITGASGENYALDFDGVDDYISLGSKSGFNLNQVTVEAWIKPDSFGNEKSRPIVDKNEQYLLRINQQAEGNKVAFFVKINNSWEPRVQSGEAPPEVLGNWFHVAGTYDGLKLRLFINGELVSEKDRTGSIDATGWPLLIGRWGESYFDGAIDEVRISNIARYKGNFNPERNLKSDGNTVVLLKFDEGSKGFVKDSSANKNHGLFWPLRVSSKEGNALALDVDYVATELLGAGSAAETIRDAVTISFWLYPYSEGNAVIATKPGSFGVLKYNKDIGFNLKLIPGSSETFSSHVHNFRTWSEPLVLDGWNHVAASYDGLNRAAKIIVNNKIVLEERINESDISENHNGDARLDIENTPFEVSWEGSNGLRFFKNTFLIDELKIYDSVKDCFDLDGDNIEECSVCQDVEIVKQLSAGESSLNENICPDYSQIVRDSFRINVLDTNTNLFGRNPGVNLCRAEPISIVYSKIGGYLREINTTRTECQVDCAEQCVLDSSMAYYQDCATVCTSYCENGVCVSDDLEDICGGTEGLTTEYCQQVLRKWSGLKKNICGEEIYYPKTTEDPSYTYPKFYNECCNITLDPAKTESVTTEYCYTQCNENYNSVNEATRYLSSCVFELNETVTVRAATGDCSGQIISSYQLEGIGSSDMFISAPLSPGSYEICLNNEIIWSGSVDNQNCPPNLGCILEATDKYVKPSRGSGVIKMPFKLTNLGVAASYNLMIYSKTFTEETPEDATGPVPDYIEIDVEDVNYPPLSLGADEFSEFMLNVNPPEKPLKLNKCYKKRGKSEKECPKYEVTGSNDLPFYNNLILRAESDTGLICEYPFDLDLSDVCKDEEENSCDGRDDDCDSLVDEAIIEVEVVRQDKNNRATGNEPLEGIRVGFYRYFENQDPVGTRQSSCMDDNSLGTSPSDYQRIVDVCKPVEYFCVTDQDGFCSVEVEIKDHPDHFMAIGILDDGETRKHLGLPVSGINCGQTKKTWHLALME